MTRFTLEATGPTVRSADRVFVYVYLDSDRGTIELGPSTVEPFALAGITAVAATCLWLLAGPAAAAAASLLGGVAGWQIIRVTSRPETPPLSWQRLVRFWPAATIAAAVVIYDLAGGDSDLANHAYGTSRSTPAVLATVALASLVWASRREALRPLTWPLRPFREVGPAFRLAAFLVLIGAFMSLAPSTKAAKRAAEAFCRRQGALAAIPHRPGHISVADARAAYAALPNMRVTRHSVEGATFFEFLTPSGRYSLGDLSIYATSADAEGALSLSSVASAVSGVPVGLYRITRLQNVLLGVAHTDRETEKCTLLGRLQRLR